MSDFIRQIEVKIGPLKESAGLGDSANALSLFSDGSQDNLRIACSIQKSIISAPNISTITLYNLSENTRAMLTPGISIVVNAGYRTGKLTQVFTGGLLIAFSERSGTDIITKLVALTGGEALSQSTVKHEFVKDASVRQAVLASCSVINGVTIDESLIQISDNRFKKGGFSFIGSASDALDRLGSQYGFSWSIQDGVFQAIDDDKYFGNTVSLNGEDGTLISVTPLLSGPMQFRSGTKIKSIFVPYAVPGNMVSVNSTISKWLNGRYKIHTMEAKLDTFSSDWTMDLHSMVMG